MTLTMYNMPKYSSKRQASFVFIVIATLTVAFAIYISYSITFTRLRILDNHTQKNEKKYVAVTPYRRTYNLANFQNLGQEQCIEEVNNYFYEICVRLYIQSGILSVAVLIMLLTPNDISRGCYTYSAAVITTAIYIVFLIMDFTTFDFHQKEYMTVHDAWECSDITIVVPIAYNINYCAYFMIFIVHAVGTVVNLMIFVGDFWAHRQKYEYHQPVMV